MYEHQQHRVLTLASFARRMVRHLGLASLLCLLSLLFGMLGYRYFEGLAWHDAFLNSAMLLGGMGCVNPPVTPSGKLFAGFYALYAGLGFLVVAGILLAPVAHRLLHTFHWRDDAERLSLENKPISLD